MSAHAPGTLALNPGSGVVHRWNCGIGPARASVSGDASVIRPYEVGYHTVPLSVLPSIRRECICTRCLRAALG